MLGEVGQTDMTSTTANSITDILHLPLNLMDLIKIAFICVGLFIATSVVFETLKQRFPTTWA